MNINDIDELQPHLEGLSFENKNNDLTIHKEQRKKELVDLSLVSNKAQEYKSRLEKILMLSGWKDSITKEGRVCKTTMEDLKASIPDISGLPLSFFTTKPSSAYLTETINYISTSLEELTIEAKQDKEALLELMKAEVSYFKDNYNEAYKNVINKLLKTLSDNSDAALVNADEIRVIYATGESVSLVNDDVSTVANIETSSLLDPPKTLNELLDYYRVLADNVLSIRRYLKKPIPPIRTSISIKDVYLSLINIEEHDKLKDDVDQLYATLTSSNVIEQETLFSDSLDVYINVMRSRYNIVLIAASLTGIYTRLDGMRKNASLL